MLACTAASVALLAKPAVITCTHSQATDHNCHIQTDDSNASMESSSTNNPQHQRDQRQQHIDGKQQHEQPEHQRDRCQQQTEL